MKYKNTLFILGLLLSNAYGMNSTEHDFNQPISAVSEIHKILEAGGNNQAIQSFKNKYGEPSCEYRALCAAFQECSFQDTDGIIYFKYKTKKVNKVLINYKLDTYESQKNTSNMVIPTMPFLKKINQAKQKRAREEAIKNNSKIKIPVFTRSCCPKLLQFSDLYYVGGEPQKNGGYGKCTFKCSTDCNTSTCNDALECACCIPGLIINTVLKCYGKKECTIACHKYGFPTNTLGCFEIVKK